MNYFYALPIDTRNHIYFYALPIDPRNHIYVIYVFTIDPRNHIYTILIIWFVKLYIKFFKSVKSIAHNSDYAIFPQRKLTYSTYCSLPRNYPRNLTQLKCFLIFPIIPQQLWLILKFSQTNSNDKEDDKKIPINIWKHK